MPFDGIVTHGVLDELRGLLCGGRVEKIFQTESDEIVLLCHAFSQHYRLLLSANAENPRIHLTTAKKENPTLAPAFCMVLRKYIQGAKILDFTQEGFDRIAGIVFETHNEMGDIETKKLVIEIMGRHSNIILLNSANQIHDSIKHIDSEVNRVREIMPARPYVLPPAQDKLPPDSVNKENLTGKISSFGGKKISGALLSAVSGFSTPLCDAICLKAGVNPAAPAGSLSDEEIRAVSDQTLSVCRSILECTYRPAIFGKDFHCTPVVAETQDAGRTFSTVNAMLDAFYTQKDYTERLEKKKNALKRVISQAKERLERKIALHNDTISASGSYELNKKYGELLTASIYLLPEYAKSAAVTDYFDENTPEITIELDENKTVSENAQRYFTKYRKDKSSYESTVKLKEKDLLELEYIENAEIMAENAETPEEISDLFNEFTEEGFGKESRKTKAAAEKTGPMSAFFGGKPASKKSLRQKAAKMKGQNKNGQKKSSAAEEDSSASRPYMFETDDGFRIFVGRNSRQNDRLTLRDSKPDDIWFHIHNAPGSHVIIKASEKPCKPSDTTMETAASLAAWFSGARNTSKADVDYTLVKNIRKIPGSHPGLVNYTDYKTVTVEPKNPYQNS